MMPGQFQPSPHNRNSLRSVRVNELQEKKNIPLHPVSSRTTAKTTFFSLSAAVSFLRLFLRMQKGSYGLSGSLVAHCHFQKKKNSRCTSVAHCHFQKKKQQSLHIVPLILWRGGRYSEEVNPTLFSLFRCSRVHKTSKKEKCANSCHYRGIFFRNLMWE